MVNTTIPEDDLFAGIDFSGDTHQSS
jgi:hypothetical protein